MYELSGVVDRLSKLVKEKYLWIILKQHSIVTSLELKRTNSKGLFVDCGGNVGQGYSKFVRIYKSQLFDYEIFEPNPYCIERLKRHLRENDCVKIHQVAVGVHDTKMKFYGIGQDEGGKISEGGSVLTSHNSIYYQVAEDEAIEVQVIDFVKYIKQKKRVYNTIVIKMDIEGSEYDVLEAMIEGEVLDSIEAIYVEFHAQYMSGSDRVKYFKRQQKIVEKLRSASCKFVLWH